ncbi:MAG: hypothetical protein GX808_03930 [Syntrophomonadaceae bacterium]|jgi:hypothetical protein|nr:hypothetical protein [Syntrophomonadaceae bacterium]
MKNYTVMFKRYPRSRKNIIVKTKAQSISEAKSIVACAFVAAKILFNSQPNLVAIFEEV